VPGAADMWDLTVANTHDFYVAANARNAGPASAEMLFNQGVPRAGEPADGGYIYHLAAEAVPVLVHNCGVNTPGERAAELQGQLPAGSQGRVTMGVGDGTDASGAVRRVVGTSERNGYLRAGVRDGITPGEEVAAGDGHAEASILQYMEENGITPGEIAAGRPICQACAGAIDGAGATPGSPLK
jgi:hypothetical protein